MLTALVAITVGCSQIKPSRSNPGVSKGGPNRARQNGQKADCGSTHIASPAGHSKTVGGHLSRAEEHIGEFALDPRHAGVR